MLFCQFVGELFEYLREEGESLSHGATHLASRRIFMPATAEESLGDLVAWEVIDTAQRDIYFAGNLLAEEAREAHTLYL